MSNKAKKQSVQDGPAFLRDRLIDVEQAFVQDLHRQSSGITHDGALGDATEDAWLALLRKYLPDRYRVAKAFAIDHLGNTTEQLDCLIYDAHFTPALFGRDNHLYVPAEAVYATFEVKPIIDAGDLDYAAEKARSIRSLQRTSVGLKSSQGENPPKPLFPIMGGLLGMSASWADGLGQAFLRRFNSLTGYKKLDLVLTAESGFCDHLNPDRDPLVGSGEGSLIRGLFRMLDALRAKATVSAIDWEKYESALIDEIKQ